MRFMFKIYRNSNLNFVSSYINNDDQNSENLLLLSSIIFDNNNIKSKVRKIA